jgi:hypothetical protein
MPVAPDPRFPRILGLKPGEYLRRRSEQVLPNHVPLIRQVNSFQYRGRPRLLYWVTIRWIEVFHVECSAS